MWTKASYLERRAGGTNLIISLSFLFISQDLTGEIKKGQASRFQKPQKLRMPPHIQELYNLVLDNEFQLMALTMTRQSLKMK